MMEHGTRYCYVNGKCRCEECKRANTTYGIARAEERRKLTPPTHGLSSYKNWCCRCPICTAANAEHSRHTREKRSA